MKLGFRYVDTWAIIWPDGRILADDFKNPEEAWKVALGWPTDYEIQHAKAIGIRCELVKIRFPE